MQKIFAPILILVLLLNIAIPPKDAYGLEAVIVNPVIETGKAVAVASALVAAGVCVTTKEAAEYAAEWLFESAPAVANDILQAASVAVNGAMELTEQTWTSLRTWTQTYFSQTAAESVIYPGVSSLPANANLNGPYYHFTDIDAALGTETLTIMAPWVSYYSKSTSGYVNEFELRYESGYLNVYRRYWTDDGNTLYTDWYALSYQKAFLPSDGQAGFRFVPCGTYIQLQVLWPDGTTSNLMTKSENYVDIAFSTAIPYTGADVLSNPTWDIQNEDGKRMVCFPPSIQDLAGKTYTDVINPTAANTGDIADITTAIGNFFDFSTPINWEPLKISGALFTNKFPFSLPWDLLHSFQVWQVPEEEVIFNISVPDTQYLKGMAFNINFDWFKGFIPIVKTIELLLFDVALIMTTRRLLGGAA